MSDIKSETLSDAASFDALGRSWSVPSKRHLSHILKLETRQEQGRPLTASFLIQTFLDADQWSDLVGLDPDEGQLEEFATEIAGALGVGEAGNSVPSSAS